MSDQTTDAAPVIEIPSLVQQAGQAILRHGLTTLAALLAAHGALDKSATDQFVTYGIAVVMWLGSLGWALWQKQVAQCRLRDAIQAPASVAVTK